METKDAKNYWIIMADIIQSSEYEGFVLQDKFKEAAEAYEILSDADKKAKYDRFGHNAFGPGTGGGASHSSNMDDIFSQFGDMFGDDAFGSFFGGGGRGGSGPTGGGEGRQSDRGVSQRWCEDADVLRAA